MWALFKLNWKSFWISEGPFWVFVFNLIIVIILGQFIPVTQLISAIVVLVIINTTFFWFGDTLIRTKASIIIKRIGIASINKFEFLVTMILFCILIQIISIAYVLGLIFLFTWIGIYPDTFSFGDVTIENNIEGLSSINWVWYIYGCVLLIILTLVMTLFFVSFSTSSDRFQIMVSMYMFLVIFTSGLFISSTVVNNSFLLSKISWLVPHTYIAEFLVGATNGTNPWDVPIFELGATYGDPLYYVSDSTNHLYFYNATLDSYIDVYNVLVPVGITLPGGQSIEAGYHTVHRIMRPDLIAQDQIIIDSLNPVYNFKYFHTMFLDLLMPYLFIIFFGAITLKTFKWTQ